ncbi:MAG: LTA synthase family protein [Prevotella sp.]
MKERLWYIIKVYLMTLLFFLAAKICFMTYHSGEHPFSAGDLYDVLIHGLSLDLSTSIYIILPVFLMMGATLWMSRRLPWRRMTKVYFALVAAALSITFVSDTSLYEFWGFKLNDSVLPYLAQPQGITASVTWWYLALRVAAVVIVAVAIYRLYVWITPSCMPPLSLKAAAAGTLAALAMIPPMIIGMRGGITDATTNIGQVYFSQEQYFNHAAVNPLFCFFSSLEHGAYEYDIYDYYDEAHCRQLTADIYTTVSEKADTLLNDSRPNVVIVIMEGCGGVFTSIGGRADITPNLNRLAREGVFFSRCYGNSWRTDRGTLCTLSGYPSFPNTSVMKMPDKSRTMPSVAASLAREGYETEYLYGGDINFTNMRSYLVATGFAKLTSMDDYTKAERESAQWGVRDDITFATLYDKITAKRGKPFLIGYSTLSSHEPWDVPQHVFDDEVLNSFNYLDNCIGNFISRIKKTPEWKNLLLIFLPDHGIHYGGVDNTQLLFYHIPMIWTGGAVRKPVVIDRICNQTDLPATLLGQMGIDHDEYTFSRDVTSTAYRRHTAMNTYNNGFMLTDSTGFVVYDLDADRIAASSGSHADQLVATGKAILQTTSNDLKNR